MSSIIENQPTVVRAFLQPDNGCKNSIFKIEFSTQSFIKQKLFHDLNILLNSQVKTTVKIKACVIIVSSDRGTDRGPSSPSYFYYFCIKR